MKKLDCRKERACGAGAALAPYTVWAAIFVLVPLLFVAYYAFTDNNFQFTTENITRFFTATSNVKADDGTAQEVRTYLVIFWRSVKLAVISTVLCLLIGYPMAYVIARAKEKTQKTMITLIMIPMWMNFLIRTYAWMTILQDTGIFNNLIGFLGLGPVKIIGTETAVIIGMVYDYLPYMVLPIYSIMAKNGSQTAGGSQRPGMQQLFRASPGHFPAQSARCALRNHHGSGAFHFHLLYFPETGQRKVLPDRRRDRGPVCGQ